MAEIGIGLVKRSSEVLKTIGKIRKYSLEELEGLVKLLGRTQSHTIQAFLDKRHDGAGLQFVQEILARHINEAIEAKEEGKKVIMIPFNFPPELIHIFENAVPFTTEVATTVGVLALEGQGEPYWDYAVSLGLPDYVCSANTIALGSVVMSVEGFEFSPDAMISAAPGSCDANSKIHEFVSEYLNIPEFIIDKTGDGKSDYELYRKLFLSMISQLENFVGEDIDEDRLIKVVERANACTELFWELHELKKHSPCPVPNMFTLFTYGTRFTMWGRNEAVAMLKKMVDVAEKRLEKGEYPAEKEVARSIWTYTGYYIDLFDLWLWMEDNGITYLTDLLNSGGFPQPVDTSTKESALEGIITTAWNYVMTRQMGAENMGLRWVEDTVYLAKDLNANCAIYSGHHACKQSQSVFRILRDELNKIGIPVLRLEGDCWNRKITPVSVLREMILDFVQNVVVRRRRRRRK
jgi:benzoyl-CoA reductase/2-hydroxyglutaryl-CoA dehydratase subunit BcrC/BadD/HgdB